MFDQFYHTRCPAEQSVLGQEGFTVRAASMPADAITSRQLHHVLADLALYELPIGMRDQGRSDDGLSDGNAPIRLSRLRTPDGNLALVHSVYRADAGNRKLSYFSHIILVSSDPSAVTALRCVSLWGSPAVWGSTSGWVWRESSEIDMAGSKILPKWSPHAIEPSDLVSLDSVCCFLRGGSVPAPAEIPALDVSPRRLQGEVNLAHRRGLVQQILSAFLSKKRVFLIAEPGLAALLIHALTQLLPEELVSSLTFSTYEPPGEYHSCSADIVNTVADSQSSPESQLSGASRDGVLINSYTLDDLPLSENPASKYAGFAVDQLMQGSLGELKAFWETCRTVVNGQTLDISCFLSAWKMHERLKQLEAKPLSDSELADYVNDVHWQPLLFELPAGRSQVIDYALRDTGSKPPWWPPDSRDASALDPIRPFLQDFRELIVDRAVRELEFTDKINEHRKLGKYCIEILLQGIADASYTLQQAVSDILIRLARDEDGHRLSMRLPWATRKWVLLIFARSAASHTLPPNDHHEKWLHMAHIEELRELCGAAKPEKLGESMRDRDTWKAQAVSIWLSIHSECDTIIAQTLLDHRSLLHECFRFASKEGPGKDVSHSEIIVKVFKALPTPQAQMSFCIASLKTGLMGQNKQLLRQFEQILCQLANVSKSWQLLFPGEEQLDETLSHTLGQDSPTLMKVWDACFRCLNISCLKNDQKQVRMMHSLAELNKRKEIKWPDETTQTGQNLDHWVRLHSVLCGDFRPDVEWHALRWSMKSLDIDDPTIFSHLIHQLTQSNESRHLGEIVDCVKAMLPRHCPVSEVAGKLMVATESLPEVTQHPARVSLLADVCQGKIDNYEELLIEMKDELPDSVADVLETKWDALEKERVAAASAGIQKSQITDLLVSFGCPFGLAIACLVVLFSYFVAEPNAFVLSEFLVISVSSLVVAFFQGWYIYKRRTRVIPRDRPSDAVRRGVRGKTSKR